MRFIYIFLVIFLSGCSYKANVKPWQKGLLAKDTMTMAGKNPLFYKYQKHIYFSKEASKGGGGVSGGGCGCN